MIWQERHAAAVGNSRHADYGKRAGFSCHDRETHGPPRQVPAAQEVVCRAALAPAHSDPERGDADEINSEDRVVKAGQHGGAPVLAAIQPGARKQTGALPHAAAGKGSDPDMRTGTRAVLSKAELLLQFFQRYAFRLRHHGEHPDQLSNHAKAHRRQKYGHPRSRL